jgi:ssRNA-specific RNase YbeY (16S rRNA maturation enzyme)
LAEVNKGTDEPVQESFEEKLKFLAKRHKKEQDHLMARLMLEKKLHEINSKSQ